MLYDLAKGVMDSEWYLPDIYTLKIASNFPHTFKHTYISNINVYTFVERER